MQSAEQIIALSFFRFGGLGARLWAFAQMGLARRHMAQLPDVGFWKLLGSGVGEGFTPLPNTAVYAILTTWPSADAASEGLKAEIFERYRAQAAEDWTVFLQTSSARGEWDGQAPFQVTTSPSKGALAAMTRATIKPRILMQFWRRVPRISAAIGQDPNVVFKIGVGEVPWLHQVTFSIWPDTETMAAFARRDGPHARAIKAVREGHWFREELYARFNVVGASGSWNGVDPLAALKGDIAA